MINYDITDSKVAYKYLLKAFYHKTNKKKSELQIRQHNIYIKNIIIIKDVIAVAERGRQLLAIENIDITTIVEVAKVSSLIDLKRKYS